MSRVCRQQHTARTLPLNADAWREWFSECDLGLLRLYYEELDRKRRT